MVPTHALRFQSMLRAITEVVIPAIDPAQKLALDQAYIIAGNLRLLLEQAGRTEDYDRAELADFRQLGQQLCGLLGDPDPLFDEALAEGSRDRAAQLRRTKLAVDGLIKAALADPALCKTAGSLVLEQSSRQLRRDRVWFAGAGFELDRQALPSLDDVLA